MFKPQKHKSRINSRDKLDFQFSDFHCIEVPEGWDKLFISLVQVGTGKTIVKSGKTTVVNGTCSWTDTFCESLSVSRGNNADSKEGGRSFFKIVVAMGSSRSGILGEVMLDLGKYAKTRTITPLSLELRKCDYGTSLQFNVQCLTERGDTGFDPRISEPTSTFREMNDGNNRSLNPPLHPMGSDSSSPSKVEGRISERDHKKLTANVNSIKKEVIEQSRAHKRLSMELEQDLKFIASDLDEARTEMEEELRFLRKSNTSLVEQLNKTQESNDELLSILQELEGIVEAQKSEIENLCSMKMKAGTNEAMEDSDNFPSEEIDNIKQQLEQLYETQEELEAAIQMLEQTVDEKDSEIERLQDLSTLSVSDYESKWAFTVAAKEEEIMMLKSELADAVKNRRNEELKIAQGNLASVKRIKEDGDAEEEYNGELGYRKRCKSCDSYLLPRISSTVVVSSDLSKSELGASEVESLKSDNRRKNEEIAGLERQIYTLKDQVAVARDENQLLKESVERLERDNAMFSESVQEFKKEVSDLSRSVEMHVSDNKELQRLSSELEKGKQDVEQHLTELEQENLQLSEKISAFETQVRTLTDEKETNFLKLRHSENQLVILHDKKKGLETEIEVHKVYLRERLEDLRTRWMEAQEECEYLKKVNPKMQLTAENVIEECNLLQKINGELKKRNMEMHTRCSDLESKLKESDERLLECTQKFDGLEEDFSNILEEVFMKEKGLKSELESLITEDKDHREKLMQEHISLSEMYSNKVVEVENLQRELVHLIDQIYMPQDGKETQAPTSDTVLELSSLRSDKAKLEIALHDLQGKYALCENKMNKLLCQSELKIEELTSQFTASRKNEEVLMIKCDKLTLLVESAKTNDAEYKRIISRHEIDQKASEYERQQLNMEVSNLKEQMQRITLLQDELLNLQASLNDAKFEYEKMKASLEWLRRDHEELKTEKRLLVQKITNMEKSLLELEDCKCSRSTLEEKVTRLERDLAAREALYVEDAKLRFELNKMQRANGELQRKMEHLKQDQEGYLNRLDVVEEQLKHHVIRTKLRFSKSTKNAPDAVDAASIAGHSANYKEEMLRITRSESKNKSMKIQSLEDVLSKALDANDMYRNQLKRLLSEEQSNISSDNPNISKTSSVDSGLDSQTSEKLSTSNLELELKELREKYFEMSVKYAEVEAQREELVLKLKPKHNRKSWFSSK